MKPPFAVVDAKSAAAFARWCVHQISACYHPDSPFSDYIDESRRPLFSPNEAAFLDALTDKSFSYCGDMIYEIAEAPQRILLGLPRR
jgi:hypothetical protein